MCVSAYTSLDRPRLKHSSTSSALRHGVHSNPSTSYPDPSDAGTTFNPARLATFCVTLLLCTGFFALWTWVSREMNNDTETAWKLIATAAFVCLGGLAAWNAKLTVASLAPSPAHGEDAAVQEDSDAVYELCVWHERAAVVHLGLAAKSS